MEDKKVLEFINKNHEESYKDFLKSERKKRKKEVIQNIILTIFICVGLVALTKTVINDTKRALNDCINQGHEYNYCLKEVQ